PYEAASGAWSRKETFLDRLVVVLEKLPVVVAVVSPYAPVGTPVENPDPRLSTRARARHKRCDEEHTESGNNERTEANPTGHIVVTLFCTQSINAPVGCRHPSVNMQSVSSCRVFTSPTSR